MLVVRCRPRRPVAVAVARGGCRLSVARPHSSFLIPPSPSPSPSAVIDPQMDRVSVSNFGTPMERYFVYAECLFRNQERESGKLTESDGHLIILICVTTPHPNIPESSPQSLFMMLHLDPGSEIIIRAFKRVELFARPLSPLLSSPGRTHFERERSLSLSGGTKRQFRFCAPH